MNTLFGAISNASQSVYTHCLLFPLYTRSNNNLLYVYSLKNRERKYTSTNEPNFMSRNSKIPKEFPQPTISDFCMTAKTINKYSSLGTFVLFYFYLAYEMQSEKKNENMKTIFLLLEKQTTSPITLGL